MLVEPGNARGLADQVAALIGGDIDWHDLREAAHRRQAKYFSAESMAAGVAHVYDKVLMGREQRVGNREQGTGNRK